MNDIIIALCICVAIVVIIAAVYIDRLAKKQAVIQEDFASFQDVITAVKLHIVSQTKDPDIYEDTSEEDLKRARQICAQTKAAVKGAPNGERDSKLFVKGIIFGWVMNNLSIDKIKEFLGFTSDTEPDQSTMFEVILMKYQQKHGMKGFEQWILEHKFDKPRPAVGMKRKGAISYYVTRADLANAYHEANFKLTDKELVDVFVTKVYENCMGWGPIDTLVEMNINGYNIGVSGSLMGDTNQNNEVNRDSISTSTNSFWVYFKSNYIHLQFIEFGTEEEIRRIAQLLIRYRSPGPLTTANGFRVNTMHDKSRILVVRPESGECWGVFVRKFSLDIKTPEEMIIKEGMTDAEIAAKFVEYLMIGKVTTAVTGRQGSGKTTLMKAIMAYLPPEWNLRVLEMAPELYLRELFPHREVFSAQETDMVSMEALQDAFKKSDATVTIVGEVATDVVAARMIQLAMTGSEMTIFSHHANTAKDLVLTVRNSLVNACGFSNMQTAEKQVTDVLKINIHLGFEEGKRFIKRITEIYQNEEGVPYPEFDPENPTKSAYNLQREYYYRQTDRISFSTHDLLYYDITTDTYKVGERMSDFLFNKIHGALPQVEKNGFEAFINYYWGLGDKPAGTSTYGYQGEEKYLTPKPMEIDNVIYSFDEAIDFLNGYNLE
jgi:pilus assembly protein CpaF